MPKGPWTWSYPKHPRLENTPAFKQPVHLFTLLVYRMNALKDTPWTKHLNGQNQTRPNIKTYLWAWPKCLRGRFGQNHIPCMGQEWRSGFRDPLIQCSGSKGHRLKNAWRTTAMVSIKLKSITSHKCSRLRARPRRVKHHSSLRSKKNSMRINPHIHESSSESIYSRKQDQRWHRQREGLFFNPVEIIGLLLHI